MPCARPTCEEIVLSVPARETVAALWLHILLAFELNHTETPGIRVVMVTWPKPAGREHMSRLRWEERKRCEVEVSDKADYFLSFKPPQR